MGTIRVGAFEIEAPPVLLEACGGFVADQDEAGICSGCGWLEADHVAAGADHESAPGEVAA